MPGKEGQAWVGVEQEDKGWVRLESRKSKLHNPSRPGPSGKVELSGSSERPGISQVSGCLVGGRSGSGS